MEERDRKQQRLPLHHCAEIELVLGDALERSFQACLHALRRLVGERDRALQQVDAEVWVLLSGHPEPERLVRVLVLLHGGLQLGEEVQRQVTILEQHPAAILLEVGEQPPGVHFLPLAHADVLALDLHTFGHQVYRRGGIRSQAEEADHRRLGLALGVDVGETVDDRLHVPFPEGLGDILTGLGSGPVRAPRPHQTESVERAEAVVAVRDRALLGLGLIEPLLPDLVAALDLVGDVAELRERAQLDQVQPGRVQDPRLGLCFHAVQIEQSTALDERVELGLFNLAGLQVDLESEHEGQEELVLRVEPPHGVAVRRKRHELDDVGDALGRHR